MGKGGRKRMPAARRIEGRPPHCLVCLLSLPAGATKTKQRSTQSKRPARLEAAEGGVDLLPERGAARHRPRRVEAAAEGLGQEVEHEARLREKRRRIQCVRGMDCE